MSFEVTQEEERPEKDVVLDVRDLNVYFDMDRGQSRVINDISIDIHREEILGIVGESGCGKSMFASALLDAVEDPGVATGEIIYHPRDDEPVDVLNMNSEQLRQFRWDEISMVFQGAMSSFNPTMKIGEHFYETIRAHNKDISERMDHARDLLETLHLDADRVLDSYPHELSGGMKQRALIALSLVLDPEVLVMDEPTAALDLLMQRSIIRLMHTLQDEYDLTIIFITHDMPLITGLTDRLAVMYAFEMVEVGQSDEIITNAAHPYTRALVRAVPSVDSPVDEMKTVEGESPDPVNIPSGCSYHPRCPLADERCEIQEPELAETTKPTHTAACFYWEHAEEEIPYTLTESETDISDWRTELAERTPSDEPLVSLDDIEVHFRPGGMIRRYLSDEQIRAVDGVSLDIDEQDIVTVVGESGCGKTTLGKVAVALQRPTDGTVSFRGQDIWEAKEDVGDPDPEFEDIRRALQIVHQDPESALNSSRTVMSHLKDPLKRWRNDLDAVEREETIYRLLDVLGMNPVRDYANRYPHQLSGGEMQRVALGRTLLVNPELILADEAVSALDVSLRVETMDLLLDLQEMFDTSYFFISHDLANARYLAKRGDGRIGVMYLGRLVEIGHPDQIIHDPKHPYTEVLRWATPPLDPEEAAETIETDPPVRKVDVPDPADPPSGCNFHPRCPEAREICTQEDPRLIEAPDDTIAACFRQDEHHEYWNSPEIADESDFDHDADAAGEEDAFTAD